MARPKMERPEGRNPESPRKTAGSKTREKIMESAEQLFAEYGYDGTSLRGIMNHANVSISLINYHFGTKEGLLKAIFESKTEIISKQRRDWIRSGAAKGSLEEIIRGYFLPSFRNSLRHQRTNHFMRLVGRIGSDQSQVSQDMMRDFFDGFQRDFIEVLKTALPHLTETDLYWRLHCLLCILTHTINNPRRIYELSEGACDFTKVDEAFENLLPFLLEGLKAPAPAKPAAAATRAAPSKPSTAAKSSPAKKSSSARQPATEAVLPRGRRTSRPAAKHSAG